jgi:uncharacterized membrane protein
VKIFALWVLLFTAVIALLFATSTTNLLMPIVGLFNGGANISSSMINFYLLNLIISLLFVLAFALFARQIGRRGDTHLAFWWTPLLATLVLVVCDYLYVEAKIVAFGLLRPIVLLAGIVLAVLAAWEATRAQLKTKRPPNNSV